MIQPIGKGRETKIGFLDTDWEAVKKEAEAINEKYNGTSKAQRLNIAKQTSGNMYSQKNQYRVNFLEGNSVPAPEEKQAQAITPNSPTKSNYQFDPQNLLQSGKSVRSSRTGIISDNGGPSRQIKSETSNSIFDTEKLTRAVEELDSRTQTERLREAEVQARQDLRKSALNKLTEQLSSVDQRKASSISPAGDQTVPEGSARFSKLSRNISIFDCLGKEPEDFARLPEKTMGEKIAQNRREESEKVDESWRSGGKVRTSKQVVNDLFDALMRTSEKK